MDYVGKIDIIAYMIVMTKENFSSEGDLLSILLMITRNLNKTSETTVIQ